MKNTELIHKVREFNRFYLPYMKLLGSRYLGTDASAAEARILYELYTNEDCNAAYITRAVNIDKSYLSRFIADYVRRGYVVRRPSAQDRRSSRLYLTDKGKDRAREFIRRSDEEIGSLLEGLDEEDQETMMQAIGQMMDLLHKSQACRQQEEDL